jgi:hypothetical protein
MSDVTDDIVREVRVLVDASVCTNPPIHKYSKFDRTLVVPLLEEAERLQSEVEQLRRDAETVVNPDAIPPPLLRDILGQVAKGEMTVEAAEVRLTGREVLSDGVRVDAR